MAVFVLYNALSTAFFKTKKLYSMSIRKTYDYTLNSLLSRIRTRIMLFSPNFGLPKSAINFSSSVIAKERHTVINRKHNKRKKITIYLPHLLYFHL